MFVKTWRVDKIVNNKSLKRVRITTQDVFNIMCSVILAFCIYLALLTGVGVPHVGERTIEQSNHATQLMQCSFNYSEFHSALFAIEAAILMFGARLCFAVKDVPDAVNESKYIAAGG